MDQQFQQYEQFFKNLFEKVKGAILPIADAKIKWQIVVFCGFILVQKGIPLFGFISDYISYGAYDDGFLGYALLLSIYPLIPFLGALLMLLGKRLGWFIIAVYLIRGALFTIWMLTHTSVWAEAPNSDIMVNLDKTFGLSPIRLFGSFLLYSGMLIFMYSTSFRRIYDVEKKRLRVPIILAVLILAIEYLLDMMI